MERAFGRSQAVKPLDLGNSNACMICKRPVLDGDRYVTLKKRQFHESCIPDYMSSTLKLLGFEPKVKGE